MRNFYDQNYGSLNKYAVSFVCYVKIDAFSENYEYKYYLNYDSSKRSL